MKNNEIKLSVIIPVYNVGDLLYRCVESVENQSLENIEIILVNDGSTDDSENICDELSYKNKNIKVIHKVNEGVSVARNLGIQIAKGEYIGFVDSDDYINKDMYLNMYTKAKEYSSDIVMCDVNIEYTDKLVLDTINQLDKSILLNKDNIYPELLMEMAGSMCKCIYRRKVIMENNISCPIGIKLSEDRIFNILAFGYSKKIFYLKEPLYVQKIRQNSATTKYYDDILQMSINSRTNIFRTLDKAWTNSEEYKRIYEKQNLGSIYQCIANEFHKECKKSLYNKYKSIRSIITDENVVEIVNNINENNIKTNLIRKKEAMILSLIAFIRYRR